MVASVVITLFLLLFRRYVITYVLSYVTIGESSSYYIVCFCQRTLHIYNSNDTYSLQY